jgi:hypothetical protein
VTSVTGASRFLIGLVTCFATQDGEPEFAAEVPGRHVHAAGERLDDFTGRPAGGLRGRAAVR